MKVTKIKGKNNKRLTPLAMQLLIMTLNARLRKVGYITEVSQLNSQSIRIGLRMRSFSVDLKVHGYNTQHTPYGSRRTNLPSWEQRVEYNNIINDVLNKFGISCKVVSGPFTIRDGYTNMSESDWHKQVPGWVLHNQIRGYYIEQGDYKLDYENEFTPNFEPEYLDFSS